MSFEVVALSTISLLVAITALGGLFVGYRWGRFAATQAKQKHASKWKAYVTALLPPALFSLSFHFDSLLSPLAGKVFFALAVAALFGVFVHWHNRRMARMQSNLTLTSL